MLISYNYKTFTTVTNLVIIGAEKAQGDDMLRQIIQKNKENEENIQSYETSKCCNKCRHLHVAMNKGLYCGRQLPVAMNERASLWASTPCGHATWHL